MKEITILEILLVTILLLMPILAGYFAWRTFKLKKTVELLRTDRNILLENRAEWEADLKSYSVVLSELDRRLILNALNMSQYKDAIEDPKETHVVRKAYKELKKKVRRALNDH